MKIELTVPWNPAEANALLVGSTAANVEQAVASARAEATGPEQWHWSPIEAEEPAGSTLETIRRRMEQEWKRAEEEAKKENEESGFTSSAGS